MIEVSVEVSEVDTKQLKTFVTCPQCGVEDFFYNFIHRTCESCGFPWGNILALIQEIRVRKYYHVQGEID